MVLNGSVRIGRITRRQLNRDSVKIRENPCSSKNIRSIRSIRTEQKPNTETHGTTRMQMGKNIRSIREIRTEQKTNTETHGTTRIQMSKIP